MERLLRIINRCLWRGVSILAGICLAIFLISAIVILSYVAWQELSSLHEVVNQMNEKQV